MGCLVHSATCQHILGHSGHLALTSTRMAQQLVARQELLKRQVTYEPAGTQKGDILKAAPALTPGACGFGLDGSQTKRQPSLLGAFISTTHDVVRHGKRAAGQVYYRSEQGPHLEGYRPPSREPTPLNRREASISTSAARTQRFRKQAAGWHRIIGFNWVRPVQYLPCRPAVCRHRRLAGLDKVPQCQGRSAILATPAPSPGVHAMTHRSARAPGRSIAPPWYRSWSFACGWPQCPVSQIIYSSRSGNKRLPSFRRL